MRLENVVALTHGELQNSPIVHTFENIVLDTKYLKRGDLFFAYNKTDITNAIQAGAYGVIFDSSIEIEDDEIAWIKVSDLDDALKRLSRFYIIEKGLKPVACCKITHSLAHMFKTDREDLVVLDDVHIRTLFTQLATVAPNTYILYSHHSIYADIFVGSIDLDTQKISTTLELCEHTLFEISFVFETRYYERQQISPFFVPYLHKLLNFYTQHAIDFKIKSFYNKVHFIPVFVNKNFEEQEFGSTQKVVIFEPDFEVAQQEIVFLQQQASWAKKTVFIPLEYKQKYYDECVTSTIDTIFYENTQKLVEELHKCDAVFSCIVGKEPSFLQECIITHTQPTLFDL